MKKHLFTLLIWLLPGFGYSQTIIKYINDGGGNRTNRSLFQLRLAVADSSSSKPVESVLGKTRLTVYPNPTKGSLTFKFEGLEEGDQTSFMLYDLQGKLIGSRNQLKNPEQLEISGQPTGIYLLKVTVNNEISEYKIIKE